MDYGENELSDDTQCMRFKLLVRPSMDDDRMRYKVTMGHRGNVFCVAVSPIVCGNIVMHMNLPVKMSIYKRNMDGMNKKAPPQFGSARLFRSGPSGEENSVLC